LVRRQYQIRAQDVDDIIAQALLDFVKADRRGRPCSDGLFLVIARRRACDFWRNRRTELPIAAASSVASKMDEGQLLERTIQERLLRAGSSRGRINKRRLLGITSRILAGATFAEACRAAGIPRGSQGRYRRTLQKLLTCDTDSGGFRRDFGVRPSRGESRGLTANT
jgi:DNA-directed RNA polymerase specialized sigma24 family protein